MPYISTNPAISTRGNFYLGLRVDGKNGFPLALANAQRLERAAASLRLHVLSDCVRSEPSTEW